MIGQENKIAVVILAAGKGSRMKSALPKVMHKLNDQPLIKYVVKEVKKINIKPLLVVSDDGVVKDYLKDEVDYVVQTESLGTGHALRQAENVLKNKVEQVVVLYGDMPFLKSASIKNLILKHRQEKNKITLLTIKVPNFLNKYQTFFDFGRIVRNINGAVEKIVEKKDASEKELGITELNTSYFCFNSDWLWFNLKKLKNNNVQGEYYLTDLVEIALNQDEKISTMDILAEEAVGINTKEHLENFKKII